MLYSMIQPKPANPVVTKISQKLRECQRERSIVLKSRIMQSNRLQAIIAGTLGYSTKMTEKERRKKFEEASVVIKGVQEGTVSHPLSSIIRTTYIGIDAFNTAKLLYDKEMTTIAKQLPVAKWVAQPAQRGFGLLFLGIVIGETGDLSGYANPGKMWRRLGCAPWEFNNKTLMGSTWRYKKEGTLPAEEWEKFGYSPRRRSIAYLIGEGIVKQNGEGPYRKLYDEKKAEIKSLHPDYSDQRCHRHGMLVATKRLLKYLWIEWNK